MLVQVLILLVSLVALLISADKLVELVVDAAKRLEISTMVLGLTVVAVGTSLPELMASGAAAIRGYPEIALGNVIGSNICNVGLILGIPALVVPITCHRSVILKEGGLMLLFSALLWFFCIATGGVPRWAGALFVLGFGWYVARLFWQERKSKDSEEEPGEEESSEGSLGVLFFKFAAALLVLLLSSEFLVSATVSLAQILEISESVIAISVIAFGTSVPELSVSLIAAKKRQGDILVGNILGSNISNILLVLGTSSMIYPFSAKPITLNFDLPLVMVFALLMVYFLIHEKGITKGRGVVLLLLYAGVLLRCVAIPQ